MAEEPQTICEWLEIDLDKLSADDKITLIGEIGGTLNAQELIRVRTLADNLRLEKLEEARSALAAKIQAECDELGLSPEEVLGIGRGGGVGGKTPQLLRLNTAVRREKHGHRGVLHRYGFENWKRRDMIGRNTG
jgi:hypothetical protein